MNDIVLQRILHSHTDSCEMSEYTEYKPERIAIIGSSCRFPGGCNSPAKLWGLLKQPVDIVTEIPESRFNAKGFYHDDPEHAGVSTLITSSLNHC
jgi:acyl transferase domain-containing protein